MGSSLPIHLLQIKSHPTQVLLWMNWKDMETPPLSCVFLSDWGSQMRRESCFFCVSHSKVGVIEGQGVFQQTGSRPLKLQVRQEGQLKTSYRPLLSEINMNKMKDKWIKRRYFLHDYGFKRISLFSDFLLKDWKLNLFILFTHHLLFLLRNALSVLFKSSPPHLYLVGRFHSCNTTFLSSMK